MRTPVYELHIRPMFRATDHEHMLNDLDLWDADVVVERAQDILDHLRTNMPPPALGGLWPDEWINLFSRWIDSGKKRLQLGSAQLGFNAGTTSVTVTASGTFPAAGFKGWLQLESETDTARTYVLYFEAPDTPVAGDPATFNLRERYSATDTRSVFVHDSTGVHQLH